jgi:hypothetical protein
MKYLCIIVVLFSFAYNSYAQITEVDLEQISYKKLKKSLVKDKLYLADNIHKLTSTCSELSDSDYSFHTTTFYYRQTIERVWNAYKMINPSDAWNGKITHFGFAFDRGNGDFLYQKQAFNGLKEGQIQFLHLRYLGGLFRLNIAHEVIRLDEKAKEMQFCYLKYGKSQGTQIIKLEKVGDLTKVTHNTYYKSKSKFRDKIIYPYFHQKTIEELHANVREMIKIND